MVTNVAMHFDITCTFVNVCLDYIFYTWTCEDQSNHHFTCVLVMVKCEHSLDFLDLYYRLPQKKKKLIDHNKKFNVNQFLETLVNQILIISLNKCCETPKRANQLQ